MRTASLLLAAVVLLQQATLAHGGVQGLFTYWFDKLGGANGCKVVTPQKNVDLKTYVSKRWFVHQQMRESQAGNPNGKWNYCVYADYTIKDANNVAVHNYANEGGQNQIIHEANLCAKVQDPVNDPGRLAVGPCFLFGFMYGPYYIVAYNEAEGWALISGGSPSEPTKNGLCKTGSGFNDSGLWIFSRSNVRDEALIAKVRGVAVEKGFDVDVLQDVWHEGCKYEPKPGGASSLRGRR